MTPCAVIIDTRNAKGMLNDFLGGPSNRATGSCVAAELGHDGLVPVETYSRIATHTSSNDPSERLNDVLRRNRDFRTGSPASVSALEGYLADRNGAIEETKIDVLLRFKPSLIGCITDIGRPRRCSPAT